MSHNHFLQLEQHPSCGRHFIRYRGDVLRVTLTLSLPIPGKAWLRSNLGGAAIHRQEVIRHIDDGTAIAGRDWMDWPMEQETPRQYSILLPLNEAGSFEFKGFFIPADDNEALWADGDNSVVKVTPAIAFSDNSIYNAFTRQFGPNIRGGQWNDRLRAACSTLDCAGFTVIPPSGTFRDVARKLDFIMDDLGFRIIQFLPIHPTPTTYGRMGRFGSPFAPVDFFTVNPELAEFDRRTTPLEQFCATVEQVHAHGGLAFIDLPVNHTGWASQMQNHHPEWFRRNPDGSIASPGAWGVTWEDLCALDFTHPGVRNYLTEVFLHWCRHGIDGFRCDAGYMIPPEIWSCIISHVRQEYPETIFFLEGLGGGMDATTKLLSDTGMDWAYSELFQNYDTNQIRNYMAFASSYSETYGPLVNFAETHDNDRLAKKGVRWAKLRIALSALFAPAGCFGIANGVEWLATEKIDVHEATSLNWDAEQNIIPFLQKILRLLKRHPAFSGRAACRQPIAAGGTANGLLRVPVHHPEQSLLVIVNPAIDTTADYHWHTEDFNATEPLYDLLSGRIIPVAIQQCQATVQVPPGGCLCLAAQNDFYSSAPPTLSLQSLKAVVLDSVVALHGYGPVNSLSIDDETAALHRSPMEFLKRLHGEKKAIPVVEWRIGRDEKRVVPLPPHHHLLIEHPSQFEARLTQDGRCLQKQRALQCADGSYFILFQPLEETDKDTQIELSVSVYDSPSAIRHCTAALLHLPALEKQKIDYGLLRREITQRHCALATTRAGGYGLVRAAWGKLDSQYDAMMAANLDRMKPVERTILFPRCRMTLCYRGYAHDLSLDCQEDFAVIAPNRFQWRFTVPIGLGCNAFVVVQYYLDPASGTMTLTVIRCAIPEENTTLHGLDARTPVTLILRPDIDDRSHHDNTIAQNGAENDFPARITPHSNGFNFSLCGGQTLSVTCTDSRFTVDHRWTYNVYHRLENERGLRDCGDLYSPGYFSVNMLRNQPVILRAEIRTQDPTENTPLTPPANVADGFHGEAPMVLSLQDALEQAMNAFIVRRGTFGTIIAGYPWFLDWGRDTLLCLRGLIAAGRLSQASGIIRQFASFEDQGTLPNMISGDDLANRETSDASLLLFVAVNDYLKATANDRQRQTLLQMDCRGRSLLEVMISIVEHTLRGTPNGIKADEKSGLVFSPAHYSWMDTNYPAATPREGYPVELQAMWYHSLRLLHDCTNDDRYQQIADAVRASFLARYPRHDGGGLSDCLHATKGQSASEARADDAVRPNQLWAITLGLVEDRILCEDILHATSALLVPGAIRSLSDQPVSYPEPVYRGQMLMNDPQRPFQGTYCGDEDTCRKIAYHNGTAWGFMMPQYCEALYKTYGMEAATTVRALLGTAAAVMRQCCLGQLPEIMDGAAPHTPRGCCAQAWSVTEFRRLLKLLS